MMNWGEARDSRAIESTNGWGRERARKGERKNSRHGARVTKGGKNLKGKREWRERRSKDRGRGRTGEYL